MLKNYIECSFTKEPASYWTSPLALDLLLLYITASQMIGVAPFLLAMGCQPLLPSLATLGLPLLPDWSTLDGE